LRRARGQLGTVLAVSGGGSWRVIAGPVRYRAQRIPFACSAEDFSLVITSTAGPGVTGTLMVGLDLGSIGPAIGKLGVIGLAVSGVVILVVALETCISPIDKMLSMRLLRGRA
jgi:hypothetical protein